MNEALLRNQYIENNRSVSEIAKEYCVSENKINYWLNKFGIPKRSISEAIYIKRNPKGDPFTYRKPKSQKELILFGLGVGLFWGEGNKRNINSVKLGNSDPRLINIFLKFLNEIFKIEKNKLRFGIQIFSDTDPDIVKNFWIKKLSVGSDQFQKVIVTPTRGDGTYKNKSRCGVLTINFANTKLKKILDRKIENPFEI